MNISDLVTRRLVNGVDAIPIFRKEDIKENLFLEVGILSFFNEGRELKMSMYSPSGTLLTTTTVGRDIVLINGVARLQLDEPMYLPLRAS